MKGQDHTYGTRLELSLRGDDEDRGSLPVPLLVVMLCKPISCVAHPTRCQVLFGVPTSGFRFTQALEIAYTT